MSESLLWKSALRKAYPQQEARYRPSGIGKCGLQQAAEVEGIEQTRPFDNIWPAELGRAGQDIVLSALPFIGFEVDESVKIEGPLPGEADAVAVVQEKNILGWDNGSRILVEVKLRNSYAYNHIWEPNGDLMDFDPITGMQGIMYMGQYGLKECLLLLLPFDIAAVRNDQRFSSKAYSVNQNVRFITFEFNPELYTLGLERLAHLKKYGIKTAPEYDGHVTFPCNYCSVQEWCQMYKGGVEAMPELPGWGLPTTEVVIG
jgi:hypothetical protein